MLEGIMVTLCLHDPQNVTLIIETTVDLAAYV